MKERFILLLILSIDVFVLLYQISSISISGHEADILYGDLSFIKLFVQTSLSVFGNTDVALRLPMMVLHVLSVILLFEISKFYLPTLRNRLWLILIYIFLPGVFSSALLVDSAGFLIFGLLLFVYIYKKWSLKYTYPFLLILSISDAYFIYLFIALIIFSFKKDMRFFLIYNFFLFLISLWIFKSDFEGPPEGHFLDLIGIYSAIFTPIIFIYIFYILYRSYLTKKNDIIWYIAAIPLMISLVLSFRQNLNVGKFAPYLIIYLPVVAQSFFSSYRVRLRQFRQGYKSIFIISAILLFINFMVVMFNKEMYIFLEDPKKHFARKMHIAKELATELKKEGVFCVMSDETTSKRLRFYGISSCKSHVLYEQPLNNNYENVVTISYRNRPIYKAIVTKINN